MKFYPLSLEEAIQKSATHRGEITFADLTSGSNTQTLNLGNVLAKQAVRLTHMELPADFISSDGTLISTSITVGDTGSANRFLTATELNDAGTEIYLKFGALASNALNVYTATDTIQVAFTATAAKALSTHTQGILWLYFQIVAVGGPASGVIPQ